MDRAPFHVEQMEVVKLTLADALYVIVNMRDEDRYCVGAVLGNVGDEVFAVNRWRTEGPAWALLRDSEPVAIFGLSMGAQWQAVAWFVGTPRMTGRSWRTILRHCRTVSKNMSASSIHRIEAHVVLGWPQAEKFARRVGMVHEGTRKRAGRHGEDILLFAVTRE